MIYEYARVFTDGQTVAAQVEALTAVGAAQECRAEVWIARDAALHQFLEASG